MRNFKEEEKNYNFVVDFLATNGYDETNPLQVEITLENDETDGQNYAFLPTLEKIWVNMEEELVYLSFDNDCERYLDDLDGTELSDLAWELDNFYRK